MYNVSEDYKKIVFQSHRYVDITIDFGTSFSIDADELVPESLIVHKKTSYTNVFSLGGCIMGEARVTVLPDKLPYSVVDQYAYIHTGLFVNTQIDVEFVPVGRFKVYNASYDEFGTTLYMRDDMYKFETVVDSSMTLVGKPYDLISEICTKCSVTLGESESYIKSLPNGNSTITLALHGESGAYTDMYIDVLRQICACISGVGVIDRYGVFRVRTYGTTTNLIIDKGDLLSGVVLNYTPEHYTQASVYRTNAEKYISVSISPNNGYNLDLGENICLQGIEVIAKSCMQNILGRVSQLQFHPFSASAAEGIFLDLCDLVTIKNYDGLFPCIITEFTYVAGGTYTFKGYGYGVEDTELIDSVVARQLSRLQVEVNSNTQGISDLSLDISDILRNFADTYNTSTSYAVGDYCVFNNTLYQCNEATTGTFTPSKWTAIQVIDLQTGSIVSYDQYLSSGSTVGKITIDGTETTIYAPSPTSVLYTPTQVSGDELGTLTVDGTSKKIYGKQYSTVSVSQTQLTGDPIGTITVDGNSTTLYAPTAPVVSNYRLLEPSLVSTNPIADGASNEVMEWVIQTEETNIDIALFTTVNVLISTTVSSDVYGDATLTITYKVDGTTLDTLEQTYGDGNQVITLSYLIHIASVGLHTISVYFGMSGGSLS
jgi:hypothetical protein